MTRAAIICTGGVTLGYGHFSRSLAFHRAAPGTVDVALYAVCSGIDRHLFRDRPGVHLYGTPEEVAEAVTAWKPNGIVWDTVDWPDRAFERLRTSVAFHASISPVFTHQAKVDVLYTRNARAPDIAGVTVLRGLEYALFGEACVPISDGAFESTLRRSSLTVAISMGGADAANDTLRVVQAVSQVEKPLLIWVILGQGYQHAYEGLSAAIAQDSEHEIVLARTNRSLWSVMSQCGVAVLAGGLTMIEAAYAGLPSLILFEREERMSVAGPELFERGASVSLGTIHEESLASLCGALQRLWNDRDELRRMRAAALRCIDGRGAERIYEHLRERLA